MGLLFCPSLETHIWCSIFGIALFVTTAELSWFAERAIAYVVLLERAFEVFTAPSSAPLQISKENATPIMHPTTSASMMRSEGSRPLCLSLRTAYLFAWWCRLRCINSEASRCCVKVQLRVLHTEYTCVRLFPTGRPTSYPAPGYYSPIAATSDK